MINQRHFPLGKDRRKSHKSQPFCKASFFFWVEGILLNGLSKNILFPSIHSPIYSDIYPYSYPPFYLSIHPLSLQNNNSSKWLLLLFQCLSQNKSRAVLAEGMVMRKPTHWPHSPFSPLLPPGSIAEAIWHTLWDSVEFRRKMSSKEMKWLIHEWLLEQLEFYRSSLLSAVLFYIQTTEFN